MKHHIVEFEVETYGEYYKTFVECKTKQAAISKAKSLAKKHKVCNVIYKKVIVEEQLGFNIERDIDSGRCIVNISEVRYVRL